MQMEPAIYFRERGGLHILGLVYLYWLLNFSRYGQYAKSVYGGAFGSHVQSDICTFYFSHGDFDPIVAFCQPSIIAKWNLQPSSAINYVLLFQWVP